MWKARGIQKVKKNTLTKKNWNIPILKVIDRAMDDGLWASILVSTFLFKLL